MEIFPVLLFALLVFIAFNYFAGTIQGHGQWTKAFEQIATRYGGWFSAARLSRPPAATFRYKDADCRVRCRRSRKRGIRETEMKIRWPNRSFRMEIAPVGINPSIRSMKHVSPISIDSDSFDATFNVFIQHTDPETAKRMISSGVRWQIHQLAAFHGHIPILITIDKGWLTIHKRSFIKSVQDVDDFVRYCLGLFDQFTLTMTEGIEFRDDFVMSAVDEVHCPICSSNIEGTMVICIRCKTPHCLDCWQYNIKCGMYACDETRYVMVGSER